MRTGLHRGLAGAALALTLMLAGCGGGGGDATPPVVVTAPSITGQPTAAALTEGGSASFSVTAAGSGPISYQWQRDGVAIIGATSATYTLAAVSLGDDGASFRVQVSNAAGTVTSSAVALSVQPVVIAPSLAVSPQSVSVPDGGSATLSVVASGTAPYTYAWRRNGSVIADATGASYSTPALTLADSGATFSVTVSNAAGSVSSANATLTVTALAPTVTSAPAAVAVSTGQTASFSVAASGTAPLAYQWLRNGTDISGATAASYTTPATALADNGASYSVRVSNAGGSITSAAAVLSVSTSVVAPAVASAPTGVAVQEGQAASFSVTASGTAPLSYQWLRNGTAISGATAASYTVPAAALGDNGASYTVRVSNAAGTITSAAAVLTVSAATSPLIGKAWAAGQPLETDDNAVTDIASAVDDAGRITVVFRKYNGARHVLYATRGTPNAAGVAPTWSTPVAIDLLNGNAVSTMSSSSAVDFNLAAAPGGNVAAYWVHNAPCNAGTYFTSTGSTCQYFYAARYLISTGAWEAPALMGDSPTRKYEIRINDRGDVAALGAGWVRNGTSSYKATKSVFLRSGTEAAFRRHTFPVDSVASPQFDLDGAGNLLLAAEASQNGTTDLVAYRGTVAAGFGNAQVLDTRGAAATLRLAGVGVNGQQVVVWQQNNGSADTCYAATADTATAVFAVQDLGYKLNTSVVFHRLSISDSGQAIIYDFNARRRLRWTASGGWTATEALPSTLPNNPYFYALASNRNGDIVAVQLGGGGDWASYDARRNVLVQAPPSGTASSGSGFVLGVDKSAGYADLTLGLNGTAVVTMVNKFDVLPTPAAPAGDGRSVTNAWASVLK